METQLNGNLALFPFQPQAPCSEYLAWKTDLFTAHNGKEKRILVRSVPRQGFNYSFPLQYGEAAKSLNFIKEAIREIQAIPIWTELQYIGNVSAGQTSLNAIVDLYDFRDSSLALLWQNSDYWQVVEINSVGSGVLNLDTNTLAFTSAYLMPLRIGRITEDGLRKFQGFNSSFSINYDIDDNITLSASIPDQYQGEDIYTDEILFDNGEIEDRIESRYDISDFQLGLVASKTHWVNSKIARPHMRILEGPTEIRDYKMWLHRRAGRYRPFWQPTFENDFQLISIGLTPIIRVYRNDYALWNANRKNIAIKSNGDWLYREIIGITEIDGNTLELTLDSLLTISKESVSSISYLDLKRLNSDKVELIWMGANICKASIDTSEVIL